MRTSGFVGLLKEDCWISIIAGFADVLLSFLLWFWRLYKLGRLGLVGWCLKNRLLLKILRQDSPSTDYSTASTHHFPTMTI